MAQIVLSVDVEASPEQTWAAVTDWDGQGSWMLGTRVRGTAQGGQGVGGGIEGFTGIGPFGVLDTMTITGWDPPRRCVVQHTGRLVRGSGAFEVEALPGGRSRFVWSEWLDLPLGFVGQVGFLLVRPLFAAGVRLSLRRFARWVPTRDSRPAAA